MLNMATTQIHFLACDLNITSLLEKLLTESGENIILEDCYFIKIRGNGKLANEHSILQRYLFQFLTLNDFRLSALQGKTVPKEYGYLNLNQKDVIILELIKGKTIDQVDKSEAEELFPKFAQLLHDIHTNGLHIFLAVFDSYRRNTL
jgi:hypothetical protein